MYLEQIEMFQGERVEIIELNLLNVGIQLELSLRIHFCNTIYTISFYNVSRFNIDNMSIPMDVFGFEIINHSNEGWAKDSNYEFRDFEDNRIGFFFEYLKLKEG